MAKNPLKSKKGNRGQQGSLNYYLRGSSPICVDQNVIKPEVSIPSNTRTKEKPAKPNTGETKDQTEGLVEIPSSNIPPILAEMAAIEEQNDIDIANFTQLTADEKLLMMFKAILTHSQQLGQVICKYTKLEENCARISDMQEQINSLKSENINLKSKLISVENVSYRIQQDLRATNLIISGLKESENLSADIEKLFKTNMGIEVQFCDAYRLGPSKPQARPIRIKFYNRMDRDLVLKKKNMLKGSSIYIQPDFDQRALKQRYELRQFAKGMEVSSYKNKPMIRGTSLIIDNKKFVFDFELNQVIEVNSKDKASTSKEIPSKPNNDNHLLRGSTGIALT